MIVANVFLHNHFVKEQGFFSCSNDSVVSLVLHDVIKQMFFLIDNCSLMFSFTHKSLSLCLLTNSPVNVFITPPPSLHLHYDVRQYYEKH